ncbi:MAG TPA: phosphate acyltransferase PlsX [Vicinamibacteria bacterium]|jgi:glycerol-3-phosphate acyltransferase PlsX|nr:phosphate acyltransferase PlsX [Vicinamibacteria bacterium]
MADTPPPCVAVDAIGGDHGPRVVVEGALSACRELGLRVRLVGPETLVKEELRRAGPSDGLAIDVVSAPDAIAMGESVSRATLKKRSSIQVAMELVRDHAADAFFSAGNTAACWTIAKMVLGTLEEVDRPALAAIVPNISGRTVLLDVGANASCKARHLEEFAVMGTVYTRSALQTPNPRVGLMSMGEEETKGTELTKEVHEVLKASTLNFIGNVEGHDLFTGKVDVIVMDGFTGNVALKASETLADSIMQLLKEELSRTALTRLGAALSRRAFRAIRRRIDPAEYGGAPLLGVNGCVVIGHGRSSALAIKHGIRAAAAFYASGVNSRIADELRTLGLHKESEA